MKRVLRIMLLVDARDLLDVFFVIWKSLSM
jgi:hypothetical protein